MPLRLCSTFLARHALEPLAGVALAVAACAAIAQPAQQGAGVPTSPLSPHPQVYATTRAGPPVMLQGGAWGPGYVSEAPLYGGVAVYGPGVVPPGWGGRPAQHPPSRPPAGASPPSRPPPPSRPLVGGSPPAPPARR